MRASESARHAAGAGGLLGLPLADERAEARAVPVAGVRQDDTRPSAVSGGGQLGTGLSITGLV